MANQGNKNIQEISPLDSFLEKLKNIYGLSAFQGSNMSFGIRNSDTGAVIAEALNRASEAPGNQYGSYYKMADIRDVGQPLSPYVDFLTREEGFSANKYIDTDGRYRIGYGSDNPELMALGAQQGRVTEVQALADLLGRLEYNRNRYKDLYAKVDKLASEGQLQGYNSELIKAMLDEWGYNAGSVGKNATNLLMQGDIPKLVKLFLDSATVNSKPSEALYNRRKRLLNLYGMNYGGNNGE